MMHCRRIDLRHRWLFTGIYLAANVYAAWRFSSSGELDIEYSTIRIPSLAVFLSAIVGVVFSYWFFLWPVFRGLERIRIAPYRELRSKDGTDAEKLVGWAVLVLQVLFLYFALSEGVYIAGSAKKSDSLLNWVPIFLVPDSLFLVYYGLYRNSSLFFPNLLANVISNVLRGWSGMWLYMIFLEIARSVRGGRFRWSVMFVVLGAVAVLLPAITQVKWIVRGLGTTDGGVLDALVSSIDFSIAELYSAAFAWISMRLQHLSSILSVIQGGDVLRAALGNGSSKLFFEEGLPQFILYRLFDLKNIPDAHSAIPQLLLNLPNIDSIDVSVVHLGVSGWVWLLPTWAPLYLLYVISVGGIGIWMMKKMGGRGFAMDAIWIGWTLYLMNGWFAAYISLLQGLAIMACLRFVAGALQRPWPVRQPRAADT